MPLASQDIQAIVQSQRTGGVNNGRYWNTLATDEKIPYVYGVLDSLVESMHFFPKTCDCGSNASMTAVITLIGSKNPIPLELVEGLDMFFKDPANRQIRIIEAMKYVTLKASGASKGQLEELETSLRRAAANSR
jgi:hypothetical protein